MHFFLNSDIFFSLFICQTAQHACICAKSSFARTSFKKHFNILCCFFNDLSYCNTKVLRG